MTEMQNQAVTRDEMSVHYWLAGLSWLVLCLLGILYIFSQETLSLPLKTLSALILAFALGLYMIQTVPGIHRRVLSERWGAFRLAGALVVLLFVVHLLYAGLAGILTLEKALRGLLFLVLPVLLAYSARNKPIKLTLLDSLLILAIWFPVEFGWITNTPIPPTHSVADLYHLYAIILAVFVFLVLRPISDMGLQLKMTWQEVKLASLMTLIFMVVFALPIGLPTGFIGIGLKQGSALEYISGIVGTAFFIALPEEILFRGIIQKFIENTMPHKRQLALILASIIFGLAHANNNNPPFWEFSLGSLGTFAIPWVYVILATIAGWFYGKTYQKTGNIAAAALVHTLVDCVWWMFFGNV